MIRIYKLREGERLSEVPSREPDLAVASVAEALETLGSRALPPIESSAIERALREVHGRSAEILVAPGGALYRIFSTPNATPKVAANAGHPSPPAPSWSAEERDALVLAVDTAPAIEAVGELLVFLGYKARAVVVDAPAALVAELERDDPLAIILGPALGSILDPKVLAACRSAPRSVVVLKAGRGEVAGADATIEVPVVSAAVSGILDAAIRRAKRARTR